MIHILNSLEVAWSLAIAVAARSLGFSMACYDRGRLTDE